MIRLDEWYPIAPFEKYAYREDIKARWTGEKRPPRAGEWYLSGAVVEAYRAPCDLTQEFHICLVYKVQNIAMYLPIEQVR